MKFKQFYLGCLSHASYYIGSEGEAAIIDPQRDIQQYLDEADSNNQKIKYVIETHSHADFVSGHIELAKTSGAEIIYGQRAQTEFPTLKVKDGDEISIGSIRLRVLETPGHTPESISILARDTANNIEPQKLFTGDTLFIGDVGRPDLIGSKGFTAEDMAGMLYDSLHTKIMPLPDDTEVYPAHGAGSICGKSLSDETWSTLGSQKRTNYALKPMSKQEFVELVTTGQTEIPAYFSNSAAKNLRGAASLNDLPKPEPLSTTEIENFDGVVLDVRSGTEFGGGHIRNAINIGLGGKFASWAGTFINVETSVAVAANTNAEVAEAVMRLGRIGIESVTGFILMDNFEGSRARLPQVTVEEVNNEIRSDKTFQFIDVRQTGEFAPAHAYRANNHPLNTLIENIKNLDPNIPTYLICQSGYRSSLAASILEKAGFREIYNVTGGTKAWLDKNLTTEASAAAN